MKQTTRAMLCALSLAATGATLHVASPQTERLSAVVAPQRVSVPIPHKASEKARTPSPRPPVLASAAPEQLAPTPAASTPVRALRRRSRGSERIAAAEHTYSGSVRDRVLAAWPGDDVWAERTVRCESNFNPNESYGQYEGLWQFGRWAQNRDGEGSPIGQSPEHQTMRAWNLLVAAGSSQWECSPYRYHP